MLVMIGILLALQVDTLVKDRENLKDLDSINKSSLLTLNVTEIFLKVPIGSKPRFKNY